MNLASLIFWVSSVGLLILALLQFRKSKSIGLLVFWLAMLILGGVIYSFVFRPGATVQAKGALANQTAFIVVLYICMLLGMVSHYFYGWLLKPLHQRKGFDLGSLLAPIFASPIVFIPLLGAFQNADVDLAALTLPRFMVFLVAFENGFFWKEVMDNQRKEVKS